MTYQAVCKLHGVQGDGLDFRTASMMLRAHRHSSTEWGCQSRIYNHEARIHLDENSIRFPYTVQSERWATQKVSA